MVIRSETSAGGVPRIIDRNVAYRGEIGQERKAFCIDYIKRKKATLKDLQQRQLDSVKSKGAQISCQKGCVYCCMAYMQASVGECEAIVYYLYQKQPALNTFLCNYSTWREQLRQNGDLFLECGQLWLEKSQAGSGNKIKNALTMAENAYRRQGMLCPFLSQGACVIYEARPLTCASLVATSPPENCSPVSKLRAETLVFGTPQIFDNSFYYGKIEGTVLAFMPLMVHGILTGGYEFLSNIPGLEGLEIYQD